MSSKEKSLKQLSEMPDSEIDYSDIPELDDNFWKNAKVVMPENKKSISLRVENDVLDCYKKHGKKYQSLMNAVLKSYMKAHKQETIN